MPGTVRSNAVGSKSARRLRLRRLPIALTFDRQPPALTPIKKRFLELIILDGRGDWRNDSAWQTIASLRPEAMEILLQIMVRNMPHSDAVNTRMRDISGIRHMSHML